MEAKNEQIKEKALQEWEFEKQYSIDNSSWANVYSQRAERIRVIYRDFEEYFAYNGGSEYKKNKDLIYRVIINNQKCFDPILVAEADQAVSD